ncbi:hypothetical protein Leryth_018617 [Lithospermum erythrorhizon]|nr:hypothetical protein Leryth_018617 [Lithospermum erythrorhizon]
MLKRIKTLTVDTGVKYVRHCATLLFRFHGINNFSSTAYLGFCSFYSSLCIPQRVDQDCVGIFWDLDNKLPKSHPPFDAAIRLKKAVEEFGLVKYKIAYANQHAFSHVPLEIREQRKERKELNKLENLGVVKQVVPYVCKVCGRRFYNNDKLINHFRVIHEREHAKRLNQIESSRGSRRVKLVGKYAMKMEKYKNAARDILTPKVGYGLADELKRAGFWVRAVSNKPQAADVALRNHIVDMMDHRRVGCVVLVSDDSDFVGVLREAKSRCLKTVVVGDVNDGALKRIADASFSWDEIIRGKAKKEAVSVVGKWKDGDVLKRIEWTYDPKTDGKRKYLEIESDVESNESNFEDFLSEEDAAFSQNDNIGAWWDLKFDSKKPEHSGVIEYNEFNERR